MKLLQRLIEASRLEKFLRRSIPRYGRSQAQSKSEEMHDLGHEMLNRADVVDSDDPERAAQLRAASKRDFKNSNRFGNISWGYKPFNSSEENAEQKKTSARAARGFL